MSSMSGRLQHLITSGVLLSPKGRQDTDIITIHVADDFSFDLIINSFQSHRNSYNVSINDDQVTITCEMSEETNGAGNNYPVSIASYKGKDICVNFWITYIGNNRDMKQTTYSVYMGV